MKIVKRILKISLWSFLAFIILYPVVWILSTIGLFGDIEFGYYRDVNIVKHAIERGDYTESLDFGIHEDLTLEDFRAFIYTKAKWKITLCFWEEMDIRQVCETPKGIIISKSKDRSQILSLESLSEALKDKDIQLRNIRDVIRHFDDVMPIIESNFENPDMPLDPDYSDINYRQYLNIHYTWSYPWNTNSIEEARQRLAAQVIERQKQPAGELQDYEFETVKLDSKGSVVERKKRQAKSFYEKLDEGVILEMVKIPKGRFFMGVSDAEADKLRELYRASYAEHLYMNWYNETLQKQMPQHPVNVPSFYMGKYEVTQAQWRAVAKLPKVDRDLLANPSSRQAADLPVDKISWEDAIEFCARLSHLTGKPYRLPTEAEWEYACRAATTTIFHFGDAVTSKFANLSGIYPFGVTQWSLDRKEAIPVGVLGLANDFGLYDMHGNVEEWCLDSWHETYSGAPSDGSAWLVGEDRSHPLRGGSWMDSQIACTATTRHAGGGQQKDFYCIGFRVVAVARD